MGDMNHGLRDKRESTGCGQSKAIRITQSTISELAHIVDITWGVLDDFDTSKE